MAKMYDSVDVSAIPSDGDIVAGYVDGFWPTYNDVVATFPTKLHVPITVKGLPNTKVCDCESGDLTPDQAASWAHNEIAAGRRPTIYSATSNRQNLVTALSVFNLELIRDVDWWEANYDGDPTLSPGAVAKQYLSTPTYDVSSTNGVWPSTPVVTPPPKPIPQPTSQKASNNMATVVPTGGQLVVRPDGAVYAFGGAEYHGCTLDRKPPIIVNNIVGIASTKTGKGYWLVGSDGGIFTFGDAGYHGSAVANPEWGIGTPTNPVVGIACDEAHENGYVLFADNGISSAPAAYYLNETTDYK